MDGVPAVAEGTVGALAGAAPAGDGVLCAGRVAGVDPAGAATWTAGAAAAGWPVVRAGVATGAAGCPASEAAAVRDGSTAGAGAVWAAVALVSVLPDPALSALVDAVFVAGLEAGGELVKGVGVTVTGTPVGTVTVLTSVAAVAPAEAGCPVVAAEIWAVVVWLAAGPAAGGEPAAGEEVGLAAEDWGDGGDEEVAGTGVGSICGPGRTAGAVAFAGLPEAAGVEAGVGAGAALGVGVDFWGVALEPSS